MLSMSDVGLQTKVKVRDETSIEDVQGNVFSTH